MLAHANSKYDGHARKFSLAAASFPHLASKGDPGSKRLGFMGIHVFSVCLMGNERRPVVRRSAIQVHSGPLLILLHDNLALCSPAVLAEVSFGKLRLNNVVVACAYPEEASMEGYFGWQAFADVTSDWADHWKLLPYADILLHEMCRIMASSISL